MSADPNSYLVIAVAADADWVVALEREERTVYLNAEALGLDPEANADDAQALSDIGSVLHLQLRELPDSTEELLTRMAKATLIARVD